MIRGILLNENFSHWGSFHWGSLGSLGSFGSHWGHWVQLVIQLGSLGVVIGVAWGSHWGRGGSFPRCLSRYTFFYRRLSDIINPWKPYLLTKKCFSFDESLVRIMG